MNRDPRVDPNDAQALRELAEESLYVVVGDREDAYKKAFRAGAAALDLLEWLTKQGVDTIQIGDGWVNIRTRTIKLPLVALDKAEASQ